MIVYVGVLFGSLNFASSSTYLQMLQLPAALFIDSLLYFQFNIIYHIPYHPSFLYFIFQGLFPSPYNHHEQPSTFQHYLLSQLTALFRTIILKLFSSFRPSSNFNFTRYIFYKSFDGIRPKCLHGFFFSICQIVASVLAHLQ
jgi:hypothetical protein